MNRKTWARRAYKQWNTCERKTRFPFESEAQRAVDRMTGERGLVAYSCPHCGGWHVGHKEHSGKRKG